MKLKQEKFDEAFVINLQRPNHPKALVWQYLKLTPQCNISYN